MSTNGNLVSRKRLDQKQESGNSLKEPPYYSYLDWGVNGKSGTDVVHDVHRAAEVIARPPRISPQTVDTSDDYAAAHAKTNHAKYDPRCIICVQSKMRQRRHIKQSPQTAGVIAIDLLQLNASDHFYVVLVHRCDPRISTTCKVDTKSIDCIRAAVIRGIVDLEHWWHCELIRRIHCDREKAPVAFSQDEEWAVRGIKWTFTGGYDSQGNGSAEACIRILGEGARMCILKYSDRLVRRKLFGLALQHSADVRNTQILAGSDQGARARIQEKDLLPFGALCLAVEHQSQKVSPLDAKGIRGIYLGVSHEVPNESIVGFLDGATDTIRRIATSPRCVACVENGNHQFPDVSMIHTRAEMRFAEGAIRTCCSCSKDRLVRADAAKKIGHDFRCEMLTGCSCDMDTPIHSDSAPFTVRRGRPRKIISHRTDCQFIACSAVGESKVDFAAACDELHTTDLERLTNIERLIEAKEDESNSFPDEDEGSHVEDEERDNLAYHTLVAGAISREWRIHVTRDCTKAERQGEGVKGSRQTEADKICGFGALGIPREESEVIVELRARQGKGEVIRDTISGMAVLDQVKNSEMPECDQKFKSRAVILGHMIYELLTGRRIKGIGQHLWSPTSSLGGLRCVFTHGLLRGFETLNWDVVNAYLNCDYPSDLGVHWVRVPRSFWSLFPPELTRVASTLKSPIFPMLRCIYGHPLSGHVFTKEAIATVVKGGFVQCGFDRAVFTKKSTETMLSLYVDDATGSGPQRGLDDLQNILTARFPVGPPLKNTRILGQNPDQRAGPGIDYMFINMERYTVSIISAFDHSLPGQEKVKRSSPASCDVRARKRCNKEVRIKAPEFVTSVLAMVLWLGRSARPDILVGVVALCGCTQDWDVICVRELAHLVGFLRFTVRETITLVIVKSDLLNGSLRLRMYSDSNWCLPKSTSGWMMGLYGSDGTWSPLLWGSRGQSIVADSSMSAEGIAAMTAVKDAISMAYEVTVWWFGECKDLELMVDNASLLRAIRNGNSVCTEVYSKAIGMRVGLFSDLVSLGIISPQYVPTRQNRANLFTKPLPGPEHCRERRHDGILIMDDITIDMIKNNAQMGAADTWIVEESRIIRWHQTSRRKLFFPRGELTVKEMVLQGAAFGKDRTTYAMFSDGTAEMIKDVWTDSSIRDRRLRDNWVGVTVFRRINTPEPAAEQPQIVDVALTGNVNVQNQDLDTAVEGECLDQCGVGSVGAKVSNSALSFMSMYVDYRDDIGAMYRDDTAQEQKAWVGFWGKVRRRSGNVSDVNCGSATLVPKCRPDHEPRARMDIP